MIDEHAREALRQLKAAGPNGLTRAELAERLGVHERDAREALAWLRRNAVAAVISQRVHTGRQPVYVYRLAQTREEYLRYRHGLVSRIIELARSVRGLDRAWQFLDPELDPLLERVIRLGGVK